jgi:hypothetical protein
MYGETQASLLSRAVMCFRVYCRRDSDRSWLSVVVLRSPENAHRLVARLRQRGYEAKLVRHLA